MVAHNGVANDISLVLFVRDAVTALALEIVKVASAGLMA